MSEPLTPADLDMLARSWITPELAEQAQLSRVDSDAGAQIVGRNGNGNYAGLVIPNIWPGDKKPREYRLRRDHPDVEYRNGEPRDKGKYLNPPGRLNLLYFAPGTPAALLSDASLPVVITEGEKKTLALFRLAHYQSENPRFLPVGLPGVWNWRGTIGKETGPNGERRDAKGPIPDLDRLTWTKRAVRVAFDSNVLTNPSVQYARRDLSRELEGRGASVYHVDIPAAPGINGVDDLLAARGPDFVLELLKNASPSDMALIMRFTDTANAELFAAEEGADLRYVKQWGYVAWTGFVWLIDQTGEVDRRGKAFLGRLWDRLPQIKDEDRRKAFAKHILRSESAQARAKLVELARSELRIVARPEDFDRDGWRLNVANGTIDLKTGELRAHDRADLITKAAPVSFDPDADCPTWEAFLDRIFASSVNLIEFVRRAVGYSLTGDTSEQVLFILYGTGANGKSTLVRTVAAMLGDYALRSPSDTLIARKSDPSIPNDVARLKGARFVFASETEGNQRLAESRIKDLTGGEKVTARFLHREFFEFQPEFKLWLSTNHKPTVRGTDNAIWRRIRLIPFEVTIPESEQDHHLADKLQAELPGILNWALTGCLEWQRNGLGTPDEVRRATEEYRTENDTLGAFLDESCIAGAGTMAERGSLYSAYKQWADENGEHVMSSHVFDKALLERGYKKSLHPVTRRAVYVGLGLKTCGAEGV
jgi:P4 family phage/plasmid primase-like protien